MSKLIDLTGKKFGRLKVLERAENDKYNKSMWICVCECSNKVIVQGFTLKSGKTKSCGCIHKEQLSKRNTTHGLRNTRLYSVWYNIKRRCYDKNKKEYKNYGERGITICDEWKSDFKNFYDWSINNGYKEGLSIDRIDNNGNYDPNNCRWATQKVQCNNTRQNKYIEYKGKTKTLAQWCEELNLKYSPIQSRLSKGYSVEKAFETPIISNKKKRAI